MMPRRPGGEETKPRKKHRYLPPIEVTEKTPKGQVAFAEGWNSMRKALLELDAMEEK